MVHLIDKDALVTEIERLQDSIKATAIDGRISKVGQIQIVKVVFTWEYLDVVDIVILKKNVKII